MDGPLIPSSSEPPALPYAARMGRHVFVPVVLGDSRNPLLRFSARELKWLQKLLETKDFDKANAEIGISEAAGKRFLRRKNIQTYLDEKLKLAALHAGTDLVDHMAWLRRVRDGAEEADNNQLKAAALIVKVLKPSGGIQVNVQTNLGVAGAPSPYKNLSADEMREGLRRRLSAIDTEASPA